MGTSRPGHLVSEPSDGGPAQADAAQSGDLEQDLTMLVWSDPAAAGDPATTLAKLGVDLPPGLRVDLRIQRPDTMYFVIPPASPVHGNDHGVVDQMDLWRSGDQLVWIMPEDAKEALLTMREQCRRHSPEASA
jgi:hypothetical protein